MKSSQLRLALVAAFRRPTLRQKEAYGRFAHTLAAAAVIGAVTILFSEIRFSFGGTIRLTGLILCGLICFAIGAILNKGE